MKFVKSIFTVCSYRVYLHFDHHLTTTVQTAPQNVGKARCDNQQRAFSCFGGKCAEPTKFTFHRQSIPPCRSSPTRKARGSNPPGRTRKPHCDVFFAMRFLFLLVFDFQNNFSSISSAASVYCPFPRRSFLSLFIVIHMRRISSVEKVAFLSAGRESIFSISRPGFSVL